MSLHTVKIKKTLRKPPILIKGKTKMATPAVTAIFNLKLNNGIEITSATGAVVLSRSLTATFCRIRKMPNCKKWQYTMQAIRKNGIIIGYTVWRIK